MSGLEKIDRIENVEEVSLQEFEKMFASDFHDLLHHDYSGEGKDSRECILSLFCLANNLVDRLAPMAWGMMNENKRDRELRELEIWKRSIEKAELANAN